MINIRIYNSPKKDKYVDLKMNSLDCCTTYPKQGWNITDDYGDGRVDLEWYDKKTDSWSMLRSSVMMTFNDDLGLYEIIL